MVSSDSDWAGLYSAIGDVRSRTGAEIKYNGMPVGWMSKFQKCKGTSFDEEMTLDDYYISTASAEAELHAAADTLKLALHIHHVAKEMNLPVPQSIPLLVDATAAIGKIQGPRGSGKMKHIDLRDAWITQLRNRNIVDIIKVPGSDNGADFFTKLLSRVEFCRHESRLMTKLP